MEQSQLRALKLLTRYSFICLKAMPAAHKNKQDALTGMRPDICDLCL